MVAMAIFSNNYVFTVCTSYMQEEK